MALANSTITEANNTELSLESEAVAYQLTDFFDQYKAIAEETSATSEELAAQVVTLNELVRKFELN